MEDLSLGHLMEASSLLVLLTCPLVLFYLVAKKKLTRTRFLRFLGVLGIATLSSLVPFGPFGLMMGFPSVLIGSLFVSLLLDKD